MKMKVVDAIRKESDEGIATIIGAVILQRTDGIPAEEAIKMDYPNTLKELQREIEIDYKQTNADRIRSMTDEELAVTIMCPYNTEPDLCNVKTGCIDCCTKWLQQEVEE